MMTTIKYLQRFIFCFLIPFCARGEITSEFQLSSDFIWRGQSQTNHGAAIQGGMSYRPFAGLSLGTWVSNTSAPLYVWQDVFSKYQHVINEDFAIEAGLIWHNFPSTAEGTLYQNFTEVELGFHWKMFRFKMDYSSNYRKTGTGSLYYFLSGQFETPVDLLLSLSWGQTTFDSEIKAGQKNYQDVHLSLGKDYEGFLFQLHTTDTNRDLINSTTGVVTKSSDQSFFVTLSRTY
jgi:uncharacterized protein (TIGR02001 family)